MYIHVWMGRTEEKVRIETFAGWGVMKKPAQFNQGQGMVDLEAMILLHWPKQGPVQPHRKKTTHLISQRASPVVLNGFD